MIALDLRTGAEPTGYATSATLTRLEEHLAGAERAIILSHYPIIEIDNPRISHGLSLINRESLAPVLARHRNTIGCCFHGHLHISVSVRTPDVLSIGVPATSFMFDLAPGSSERESITNGACGYLIVGLGDDGTISMWPRWITPA
jgi:hypothetical protein